MEQKAKWIVILSIVSFILFCANFYLNAVTTKTNEKNIELYNENEDLKATFTKLIQYNTSKDECFLWIIKDGVGISTKTEYCGQLDIACSANYHNLSCIWVEHQLVDINGNLLNNTARGCECIGS